MENVCNGQSYKLEIGTKSEASQNQTCEFRLKYIKTKTKIWRKLIKFF